MLWDPKQRFIVFSGGGGTITFWHPLEGGGRETRVELRPPVGGIAFSSEGGRVVAGNDTVASFFLIH